MAKPKDHDGFANGKAEFPHASNVRDSIYRFVPVPYIAVDVKLRYREEQEEQGLLGLL